MPRGRRPSASVRATAEPGQPAAVHTTLVREELDAPPDPAIPAYAEQLLREAGVAAEAERVLGEPPDDEPLAWRHRAMAGLIAARRQYRCCEPCGADLAAIDTPYLFGEPA